MGRFYIALFFICMVVIEFLATTTTVRIEIVENMWDKANHFIAFFVLYILLSLAFKSLSIRLKVLLLLVFGLHIEIVQNFIEGRYFSLLDVVADAVGIAIGVVFYKYFYKRLMKLL